MQLDIHVTIKIDRFTEKEALQKEFLNYKIVADTEQIARGMLDSILSSKIH